MEELIIIGGGIAGLSCLNALLDRGVSPLLLEASTIGTPKMCGEFLAPQTTTLLQTWGIGPLQQIDKATFFAKNKNWTLSFPQPAGAMARSEIELLLAERGRKLGGRIREYSLIKKTIPATESAPYIFYLASGEVVEAKSVIFATGKYGQQTEAVISPPYFGIKTHFKHIASPGTLLMYSFQDAYLGVIPISDDTSNCACLVKREAIERAGSCRQFFDDIISKNSALKNVFKHVDFSEMSWLEGQAPEFHIKSFPDWPNAFWIGDAVASLHPAIGSGFAHGVSSAVMAAEFYLNHKPREYRRACLKQVKPKLQIGKMIHQLLFRPLFGVLIMPLLRWNPWIITLLQNKIGYITK